MDTRQAARHPPPDHPTRWSPHAPRPWSPGFGSAPVPANDVNPRQRTTECRCRRYGCSHARPAPWLPNTVAANIPS